MCWHKLFLKLRWQDCHVLTFILKLFIITIVDEKKMNWIDHRFLFGMWIVGLNCLFVDLCYVSWLAVSRKYDLLYLRKEVCLQSNMYKLPPTLKEKGEPWHLLTCKDYVVLAVIDWLASLQEMLLVRVLCSNRARALLNSTSSLWRCGHASVHLLL